MWPLYSMKAANCKYFPFSAVEDDVNAKFSIKVTKVTLLTLVRVGHTIYVQSIHGICRYFAKGVSMDWPYYVCLILVKVSMESADTLSRGGIHGLAILCMSNIGQSIHGIHGYFAKGYPWLGHTMYIQSISE